VALAYTTIVIILFASKRIAADPEVINNTAAFVLSRQSVHAIPMMVFAFQCHATVVQVFAELEDSPSLWRCSAARKDGEGAAGIEPADEEGRPQEPLLQRRALENPRKASGMLDVISLALLECLVGYSLVGIFGYLAYPTEVESDVLKVLPGSSIAIQAARAMMGLTGVVSYPVNLFPCRQALDHLLAMMTGLPSGAFVSQTRHTVTTLLLFVTSLATALMVTDLGSVFQVVGGTAGGRLPSSNSAPAP